MSTYNTEQFVSEAVESILGQTFREFNFIIVDDGSVDGTLNKLQEFQARDRRIELHRRKHRGLVASLNEGCSLAAGTYIARIDGDDAAVHGRLQWQLDFLEENPRVAVVGGQVSAIGADGRTMGKVHFPTGDTEIRRTLRKRNCICHSAVMFRREVFVAIGGYREAAVHAEDYDLWLRIADQHEIANLHETVGCYRFHGEQVSVRYIEQQVLSAMGAWVAARMRRRSRGDPLWFVERVTRDLLIQLGVGNEAINRSVIKTFLYQAAIMAQIGRRKDCRRLLGLAKEFCALRGLDFGSFVRLGLRDIGPKLVAPKSASER